nr:methyltransferase domain-containing protein [Propionibacterium sp.]
MSLDAARGLLACPRCAGPLTLDGGSVGCPAGHRFDVARQGYVNLANAAPPANAHTPAMLAARDRFLASGLYDRIADDVAARVAGAGAATVVEVGAGTGFYLGRVLDAVQGARGVALDVSPAAARRAARTHPRAAAIVADVWQPLPLRSGRFGAVVCVFAPRNMPEFARVLAAHGLLVVVTPTAAHLDALRARHGLLGIEDDKDERLLRSSLGLFEAIARNRLDYRVRAPGAAVRDLIAMGPNAFHGVPDDVEDAEMHVSVTVSLFRRPAG